MTSVSTISSTNDKFYSTEAKQRATDLTHAKIKQIALYIFAALLAASAIPTALLAPSPFGFCAIPLAFLSILLTYVSYKIKDYDNPEKLKLYQSQAKTMTFYEIHADHGLKNAVQYRLLPSNELREKFNVQVQAMDFSAVLKAYNVEELLAYNIASPDHISLLRKLSNKEQKYRIEYVAAKKQIDLQHQGRTDVIKKRIRQAKLVADTTAMAATPGNTRDRVNAYASANVITTPLALVGDFIAEGVGRDSQISYEHQVAKARSRFHRKMNHLEEEYNQYKRLLA